MGFCHFLLWENKVNLQGFSKRLERTKGCILPEFKCQSLVKVRSIWKAARKIWSITFDMYNTEINQKHAGHNLQSSSQRRLTGLLTTAFSHSFSKTNTLSAESFHRKHEKLCPLSLLIFFSLLKERREGSRLPCREACHLSGFRKHSADTGPKLRSLLLNQPHSSALLSHRPRELQAQKGGDKRKALIIHKGSRKKSLLPNKLQYQGMSEWTYLSLILDPSSQKNPTAKATIKQSKCTATLHTHMTSLVMGSKQQWATSPACPASVKVVCCCLQQKDWVINLV